MGESMHSEFLLEVGGVDTVKHEPAVCSSLPQEMGASSASVPIPGGHRAIRTSYDQFSPSPLTNLSLWGHHNHSYPREFLFESPFKVEVQDTIDPMLSFKMDDDDIFQVDKADLIQGPTLAELNANDDTLLDLNFDDLLLPEENMQPMRNTQSVDILAMSNSHLATGLNSYHVSSSFPQLAQGHRSCSQYVNMSGAVCNSSTGIFDVADIVNPQSFPTSGTSNLAGSSTASSSTSPRPFARSIGQSTLHELLLSKGETNQNSFTHSQMETVSISSMKPKISRLSMSAPTQSIALEQIWARREPRQHLLSTGSLSLRETGSNSSLSTGSALSPNPLCYLEPLSHDEGYEDSDDDSDHYDDCSSDNAESGASDNEDQISYGKIIGETPLKDTKQKKEKYFWQYNVQAKGPKGQRLVARVRLENPHILNEVTDPVFSPNCALRGIKHSGKARKGDGNDLTPNPRKLHNIGKELDKLSQVINDMTPVSELPFPVRPKTRKEKNKLASRACRLKKKAQHEANKIKLHGLEQEHKRLIHGIVQAKQILAAKLSEANAEIQEELTRQMDKVCNNATKVKIANHSTEFVNKVLEKVKAGVPDGGIDDF